MKTCGLRASLTIVLLLAVAFVLFISTISSCGSSKQQIPPYYLSPFSACVYLAPDSSSELPTMIRFRLAVSEDSLPLSTVSFDPDGDGGMRSVSLDFYRTSPDESGEKLINFYSDCEWNGPDETMAEVTIVCATGTYSRSVWLQLDQLPLWPY